MQPVDSRSQFCVWSTHRCTLRELSTRNFLCSLLPWNDGAWALINLIRKGFPIICFVDIAILISRKQPFDMLHKSRSHFCIVKHSRPTWNCLLYNVITIVNHCSYPVCGWTLSCSNIHTESFAFDISIGPLTSPPTEINFWHMSLNHIRLSQHQQTSWYAVVFAYVCCHSWEALYLCIPVMLIFMTRWRQKTCRIYYISTSLMALP